ncbi:hypothetical protein GCM10010423_75320 [Streptomyces levis]|uniref:Uncharacterized protein n=1 Tax=Streptomyces levis TaxID=285566 RepID=A0ABN3P573_9ACTN
MDMDVRGPGRYGGRGGGCHRLRRQRHRRTVSGRPRTVQTHLHHVDDGASPHRQWGCGIPGAPPPRTRIRQADTSNLARLASARASGVSTGRGTRIPQSVQTGPAEGS